MEPPSSQSADPRHSRADVVDGAIDAAQARDDQIEIAETPPHPAAAELAEEEEEEDGSEFLERARSYEEAADERAYEPEEQIDVSRYSLPLQTADDKPDGFRFSWRRFCLFVGPGFLMSIAYLDPGNLESDLQAGAQTGYSLLWILFWSTALGLLLQAIAARVGVVTGCHLAELCRMEYSPVVRTVLWLMAEVAIVGADIQEVIGCAIAIRILTQGAVPLWAGVLITGLDSFLLLFLENLGIRKLEALFGLFISIMAVSFARMFLEAAPDTGAIAQGLLIPSIPRGAMGMAVSIVGAVIMPHNIFLHSALVQSRAIDRHSPARVSEALVYFTLESAIALLLSFLVNLCVVSVFAKLFYGRPGAVDIGLDNAAEYLQEAFGSSTFPVVFIWAAGLLAAGQSSTMTGTYAGQFVMSGFLDLHVCKWEAFGSSTFPVVFIWAAGLLAAGQSSTMTGTYAGQFVMSGFLDLHVRKWVRVLVTRTVAIVPTIVVALLYSSPAASPPVAALFVPLTGAADTSAAAAAVPTFVNVSTPFRPATATAAASLLFSSPLAALPSPITDHSLVSSISPSNASLQFITSLAASLPFSSTPHSSSYPLSSPPPLSLPHSPLMPLSPPPCSPSPRWIPSTSGSTSSSPCSCPSPSSPFLLSPRHRTSWGDTQSRGRSRC
ncbi:hypothetical protein CLOM_g4926 [Closterium sp. NIES-68]|nr:hypothetical protein CLOM_g4926 [Closterium sp. NIES-68]